MVTRQTRLTPEELDEWEREDALYQEMIDQHHHEWFAIVGGRLYHSPDHGEVVRMLQEAQVQRGGVLISYMSKPPFRICSH